MSESGGEEEDDAARAFENLREEVASLRRGIELVYRQGQEAKGVDYSLTLGEMAGRALREGIRPARRWQSPSRCRCRDTAARKRTPNSCDRARKPPEKYR